MNLEYLIFTGNQLSFAPCNIFSFLIHLVDKIALGCTRVGPLSTGD